MRAGTAIASSMRHIIEMALQALLIASIVAGLAFAAATVVGSAPGGADSVLAARGGNGGGGGGGNGKGNGGQVVTTPAWVRATPGDAAAWGSRVDIDGCGYAFAPAEVRVVHSAGASEAFVVGVWSSGCMASTYLTTQEPGIYTIEVYQVSGNNGNETSSLLASTTVSVN